LLVALLILFAGYYLNSKIAFLKNNNIPEPVVGGIAFSILAAFLHAYFDIDIDIDFEFDMVFKSPLMTVFSLQLGLALPLVCWSKEGLKSLFFLVLPLYI
jgi:ESS family glutamate:Na+ symporter